MKAMVSNVIDFFLAKKKIELEENNMETTYRILTPGRDINPHLHKMFSVSTPFDKEDKLHPYIIGVANSIGANHEVVEGNLIITLNGDPTTMFSCHLDINSAYDGDLVIVESISDNPKNSGFIRAIHPDTKKFMVLGGDDKVGAYVMLRMMEALVPGTYVFHAGEERGCVGSRKLRAARPDWLKQFTKCIAFDRTGTTEVIYNQRNKDTASVDFAKDLCTAFNSNVSAAYNLFEPSDRGAYTDSASYADIIPECVNVAVGYFNNHSASEKVDHVYVENILIPAAIKTDYKSLASYRDVEKIEVPTYEVTPVWKSYHQQMQDRDKLILQYGLLDPVKGIARDISAEGLAAQLYVYKENKWRFDDFKPLAFLLLQNAKKARETTYLRQDLDDLEQLLGELIAYILSKKVEIPEEMQKEIEKYCGLIDEIKDDVKKIDKNMEVAEVSITASVSDQPTLPLQQQQQITPVSAATSITNKSETIVHSPDLEETKGKIYCRFQVTENGRIYYGNSVMKLYKKDGKELKTVPEVEGTKVHIWFCDKLHHMYTVGKHGHIQPSEIKLEWIKRGTINNTEQQTA